MQKKALDKIQDHFDKSTKVRIKGSYFNIRYVIYDKLIALVLNGERLKDGEGLEMGNDHEFSSLKVKFEFLPDIQVEM